MLRGLAGPLSRAHNRLIRRNNSSYPRGKHSQPACVEQAKGGYQAMEWTPPAVQHHCAAVVTDIRRLPSGRHFASFLGLTPKENSSGSRRRLGDVYLRMLVTHGPRSLLWHAKATTYPTSLQRWAVQTATRNCMIWPVVEAIPTGTRGERGTLPGTPCQAR
jgi:hypothetical protein